MKPKKIISAVLLIFVAVSVGYLIFKNDKGSPTEYRAGSAEKAEEAPEKGRVLVVYLFHGAARCSSCKIIEAFGKKALENGFPAEMKSGRVVWRDISLDEPENRHFVQDFQIISISLILSDMENGKQTRWKNLEEVWSHLDKEKRFVEYVQREVRAWLQGR